jgi:hypothetical protein
MSARILINKATLRRWLQLPEEARLSFELEYAADCREFSALVVHVELPSTPVTPPAPAAPLVTK